MSDNLEPRRRDFPVMVIYGLGALMCLGLAAPAAVYLLLPPRPSRESEWTEAADLDQVEPDDPKQIFYRRTHMDGWKVTSEKTAAWLVILPDGKLAAFSPWCTHLGCAYHRDATTQQFACPCHESVFEKDGRVAAGPAPRPLDRYEIKIENGKLWIGPLLRLDKGRA